MEFITKDIRVSKRLEFLKSRYRLKIYLFNKGTRRQLLEKPKVTFCIKLSKPIPVLLNVTILML